MCYIQICGAHAHQARLRSNTTAPTPSATKPAAAAPIQIGCFTILDTRPLKVVAGLSEFGTGSSAFLASDTGLDSEPESHILQFSMSSVLLLISCAMFHVPCCFFRHTPWTNGLPNQASHAFNQTNFPSRVAFRTIHSEDKLVASSQHWVSPLRVSVVSTVS